MAENLINSKAMSIYEKLLEVRKSVQYLKKDKKGFNYNYASGSQVIGNLRGKLDELGLLLKPEVIKITYAEVKIDGKTEVKIDGKTENLVTIEILFTWINVDNPTEKIECHWFSMGQNTREKGIGSALTYAERYFLLKFFMIPTDEMDPDAYNEKYYSDEVKSPNEPIRQPTQPPPNRWKIDSKIPDDSLPAELRGRAITFLDLGKTPNSFTFQTKANGIQNGKYLLQYWGNTPGHSFNEVAIAVLDTVSQASDEAVTSTPQPPQQ